jgi:hypothetical protein
MLPTNIKWNQVAGRNNYNIAQPGTTQQKPSMPIGAGIHPCCSSSVRHTMNNQGSGIGWVSRVALRPGQRPPHQAASLISETPLRQNRLMHRLKGIQMGEIYRPGPALLAAW